VRGGAGCSHARSHGDGQSSRVLNGHDEAEAGRLVDALASLAARGDMRELVVRAHLHRSRLGDPSALATARLLAAGIDNPALAPLLDGHQGAATSGLAAGSSS
jgi:hypothetical protein